MYVYVSVYISLPLFPPLSLSPCQLAKAADLDGDGNVTAEELALKYGGNLHAYCSRISINTTLVLV